MVSTPPQKPYRTLALLVQMSTISFQNMSLPDLLTQRSLIDAAIGVACGGAGGAGIVAAQGGKKGKKCKDKKPSARTGKPTSYGDFSSKIQKEHEEEIKAFKEANPEMKGAHMTWVGNYKKGHAEEYEAFKAEWTLAHPKAEVTASDADSSDDASAEGAATEAKPKKVLSPEHLAKMKAGREAKKAAKDAAKASAEEEGKSEAPIALSPAPEAKEAKPKKEPKKAKKSAPEVVAAPVLEPVAAPVPEPEEKDAEELPFKLGGATYIRMGVSKPDGNHEWLSGDLWLNKKGSRGPYAGELMEDGSINTDAEEPTVSA